MSNPSHDEETVLENRGHSFICSEGADTARGSLTPSNDLFDTCNTTTRVPSEELTVKEAANVREENKECVKCDEVQTNTEGEIEHIFVSYTSLMLIHC